MRVGFVASAIVAFTVFGLPSRSVSQGGGAPYVNFEGAPVRPIRLSPDGSRLFAIHPADSRVSVYDLVSGPNPQLIAEIPVGLEPVSVNPRTADEVWVVNEVSDSISIVSVSLRTVVDTIYVKDEPADVVFAEPNLAFVSVARSNEVRIFNVLTRALIRTIALPGHHPRALAVGATGTKVYTAFALSGNRTTLLPPAFAPAQPPPTNPSLPAAPKVGLIVDAADPRWAPLIRYTLPDIDVAEIDTASLQVTRYFSGLGTTNLALAVMPQTGDIFLAGTDARNLVRFEPNVRGHWVDNRLTRISQSEGVRMFDLNAGIDYSVLPNPAALQTALAQPTAIEFEPSGSRAYVAAFGTDRVAVVDPRGRVLKRIDIGPVTGSSVDPRRMRGPRGLALDAAAERLYVFNRITSTISIIDTSLDTVIGEFPVGSFDPTPAVIRDGRGFLYDAKLSGNGTGSCASCHVDAGMDFLAWDLGDPGGDMQVVVQNGQQIPIHPMKGPMATQTLRGLSGLQPFHWRGDRADFAQFNPAFDKLMGGSPLSTADMQAFTAFINTVRFAPNPNQNLDRTLPATIDGGDPTAGRNAFLNEPFDLANPTGMCKSCHTAEPGPGSSATIIPFLFSEIQPLKVPQLRNMYQKRGFTPQNPYSILGFGIVHDGSVADVFELLSEPRFGTLAEDSVRKQNLQAYVLCFDTGMAPAVGYTRTLKAATLAGAAADWQLLEAQAALGHIDLVAKGRIDGQLRGFLYRQASGDYLPDTVALGPLSRTQLVLKLRAGGTLTVMGVPPGLGGRMAIDRDLDGTLDADEP